MTFQVVCAPANFQKFERKIKWLEPQFETSVHCRISVKDWEVTDYYRTPEFGLLATGQELD